MKNKKIVSLIILVIIIIILILILLLNLLEKAPEYEINNENETIIQNDMQKVSDKQIFYSVSNCVQKFYDNKQMQDEENYGLMNDARRGILYNLLDKTYISKNKITVENILDNIGYVNDKAEFIATEMYSVSNENYTVYSVKGIAVYAQTKKYIEDAIYKIVIDSVNGTFSIEPLDIQSIDDLSNYNLTLENLSALENNFDNLYSNINVNEEYIINNYISYYRAMVKHDIDKAYELLDEEYRNQKFGDLNTFKQYIINNKEKIDTLYLYQYYTNQEKEYTQYVIKLTTFNNYTFNEKGVMNFSIFLDDYTVDTTEFIQEYENGSNKTKAGLNSEKVISAINDGDYKYVYSKLDETFKNNNFDTLQKFEEYVKNNFFEANDIEYENYVEEGNLSIFRGKIVEKFNNEFTSTNQQEIIVKQRDYTIIIKLLENRDFVMSFSIQ